MSRASVNEILPGRLYQRANFLTWPYEQKQRLLREHQIDVICNLWTKVDPDLSSDRRIYLCWPIPGDRVPVEWRQMRALLSALLRNGHRLLVHCEAGVNRSVWLAALLVAEVDGKTGAEALEAVEQVVPRVMVRAALRNHLLEL